MKLYCSNAKKENRIIIYLKKIDASINRSISGNIATRQYFRGKNAIFNRVKNYFQLANLHQNQMGS